MVLSRLKGHEGKWLLMTRKTRQIKQPHHSAIGTISAAFFDSGIVKCKSKIHKYENGFYRLSIKF